MRGGSVKTLAHAMALLLILCPCALAQTTRRIAFLPANSKFADLENRLSDGLVGKFAGRPGFSVIDRQSIEKIIKEQNFQNSDRSSPDTAARIGKIAGVGQIVMVQVDAASYTATAQKSGDTTTAIGTVILQAHARTLDVETAAILTQPSSSFEDHAVIGTATQHKAITFGAYHRNASQTTQGNDPKVVETDEVTKAVEAVSTELASKLATALASAPGPKAAPALVAGIAGGSVYINEGSTSGIKVGDRFQVTRKVNIGLNDPKTGQPLTRKIQVCELTVNSVDETNSSGSCSGGIPQNSDVAEPVAR
jgi:flagellar assembly FlgT-like protein/curli production assembly/transport component CsgG